jgi:outer membrane protein insertion porin family
LSDAMHRCATFEERGPVRGRRDGIDRERRPAPRRTPRAVLAVSAAVLLATSAVCPAASADAAEIVRTEVEGHKSLSTRDVVELLGARAGATFEPGRLAARADSLVGVLASLGRPFALVEAQWDTADGGVELFVSIDEGPEVRIDRFFVSGVDGLLAPSVLGGLESRSGSVVSGDVLRSDAQSLLDHLGRSGRPLAEVRMPSVVELGGNGLNIVADVSPGPDAVFGDVVVAGNTATRDEVIVRETRIRPGEPYDRSRVAAARAALEKLHFIDSVGGPVVAVDPASGVATVGLTVVESPASSVTGVLGYAGTGSGDSELTGLVDVRLGNIAGTGRSASAAWERIREGETVISFSYVEPWLLGAPIDVGVSGNQSVRDTFYTTTEADLFVTARMGDRVRLTWSIGGQRYVPGASGESTTTSTRTGFAAAYDGADAPANPTTGTRLSGRAEYAAKEYGDTGADETSGTFSLSAERFVRLRPRHVIALSAGLATLVSTEDEVPFHELLTLGGARSLRGYREEQFRGTRTALGSLEYRIILSRRSRVVAFVDAGYCYRPGPNFAKDSKLGYGIGLRGETRLGTIAIDYGLGEGDRLLDGKLHAGIIREF